MSGIRPEYDRMLADPFSGKFEAILVWKIDRLSRDHYAFCGVARKLMEEDVALISVHEHIDMTTATGRFFVKMQSLIGELEAETLKTRTDMGRRLAKARGKKFGRKRRHDYRAIVEAHHRLNSVTKVAQEFGLTKGTVSRIIRTYDAEQKAAINPPLTVVQSI